MFRPLLTVSLILLLPVVATGQSIYPDVPDWVSADTRVSTGGALVDLDRDGWLDLVVANGNDIALQQVAVYYNQGDGSFPANPDWLSDDLAYNGHLDVADVNGDGWQDVAVAVLGTGSSIDNAAKLYLNSSGALSSSPDWQTSEVANAFSCAFGDVDNDGRPDLAIGTGWSYSPQNFAHNLVYVNSGSALPSSASWTSNDQYHFLGVTWTDANRDGWLDLVGVASLSETRIYTNTGGTLETTASWTTTDSADQDAIMAVCGDVTGDGLADLIITDNTQIGSGSGRFRLYPGLPQGYFSTTYTWSFYEGYGSAVALADLNGYGLLDLATGGWWEPARLFLGTAAGLPSSPDWSSAVTSVIEKISFGDVDRSGLRAVTEVFPSAGSLIQLQRRAVQEIVAVRADAVPLAPADFTFDREAGWVNVGSAAPATVEVDYVYSMSLDMAITNWDSDDGNYLYLNRGGGLIFADGFETGDTSGWSLTQP